jgi:cellulose synthase/poly-beta-1,6-N-acetylglucosamine synthase-like glycosyltransferase
VAFADPLYKGKVQEIEVLVNQKVIPCLAGRDAIDAAVERILGQVNLGTSLLMAGRITLSQLNDALTLAENTNIRIGRALVHRGYITEQALYRFLAHQARLPLFDLSSADLDVEAAHLIEEEHERRLGILPLAADDSHVFLAMVDPLNQEGITLAQEVTGKKVTPILVAERNFDLVMEKLYQDDYLSRSVSQLLTRSPDDSAFRVFSHGQIITMLVVALVSIAWLIWDYTSYLIVVNSLVSIFYLIFSGYKAIITSKALKTDLEVELTQEDIDELDDRDLPVYTLLVPVYKEANVLPQIIKCLSDLDYPKTKLDIKILMEANDQETIDAFYNTDPPEFIHDIIVPDAQPKTKPKACNYGLIHARGEFLVIYDAEDLPERDQLKRSVAAFRKVPADVVCIQAKLNYHNRTQNILTQWFTSEYSMWFDLLLPGLDASHAPIPLGGTSNHFKTFSLIEVGAWDPYNVTEDADLGIRLYKRGYRTRIMDSTTYEEANSEISNWIRQRSRWVKGYIQTWLVHMRHPLRMLRELGWSAFMSFQIMIGGTFLALLVNPIYWLMTTAWFLFQWEFIQTLYPGFIFYVGAICLYVGNFVFTYANVAGAMRRKYYDMVRITLFSPLYWGLMSLGAWKGFIQLLTKPHFWEKTIHGLHDRNELEEGSEQET